MARFNVPVVDTSASTTFTDKVSGIENVIGTAKGDLITGDDYANSFSGGKGNDLLTGAKGNDR